MSPLDRRQFSPSAERNRDPILSVLRRVLPAAGGVLEVGSGTGEHAVHFARHLPALRWQPSDADPAALASITDWVAHSGLPNLLAPVCFDLAATPWPVAAVGGFDLDHLGAELGEDARGEGAGDERAELDDLDAGEGFGGCGHGGVGR